MPQPKKKTPAQLEREIREFLAGAKRTFMRPEITDKQVWAFVETNSGSTWIPGDVLTASELAAAKRGDFEPLLKYTEGSKIHASESKLTQGYGVRLQAPGYMDASDWEVYTNKQSAMERALELAREYEGEED